MKNWILSIILFLFVSSTNYFAQDQFVRCATDEYLQMQLEKDPKLRLKLENMESRLQEFIDNNPEIRSAQTVVTIPVVVHVIWNTAAQNISENMITSQIRVLNEDFRKMFGTPGHNTHPAGADTRFEFRLANRDPNGNPHSGINRVQTAVTSWNYQTQDAQLKALSYWPSQNYLNLWVANLSGGVLGYAQFPGGNPLTDGVVILWSAFGYNSPAAPYNLGRTTTHEVGHWLNLRHTWGDVNNCNGTDFCDDTPPCSGQYFSGVPSCPAPVQCFGLTRMIENYMDYSDDGCMNVYTNDQTTRMKAAYTNFRPQLFVSFKETLPVAATGVDYNFTNLANNIYATINFSNLGSVDTVTVEVFPNILPPNMPLGTKAVRRYFDIKANGTGYNATLTVRYEDTEVVGFINGDSNLKLFRYNTLIPGWVLVGGTGNPTANTVTLSNVTEFSLWALSDPLDNPIPVELTSFTAEQTGNGVLLNWATASEINNKGFGIERSSNGIDFIEIAFVDGKGTSTLQNIYSYKDNNVNTGTYYYRLKQNDFDGTFTYSNVIAVDITLPSHYVLEQNHPNPFNPSTKISFELPVDANVKLTIYNTVGQQVFELVNSDLSGGRHEYDFNATNLSSGIYYYTINAAGINGSDFSATKKMILVK